MGPSNKTLPWKKLLKAVRDKAVGKHKAVAYKSIFIKWKEHGFTNAEGATRQTSRSRHEDRTESKVTQEELPSSGGPQQPGHCTLLPGGDFLTFKSMYDYCTHACFSIGLFIFEWILCVPLEGGRVRVLHFEQHWSQSKPTRAVKAGGRPGV